MARILKYLVAVAVLAIAAGLWLTRAQPLPDDALAGLSGEATHGKQVFTAAGCASCHAAPEAKGADKLTLSGGQRFASDFGTFIAPNISPDPTQGIGGWTLAQFASAVTRGVSPEGQHLYPAFPYTSYVRMTDQDVADLWAYMQTLPASDVASLPHEVGFPFNIRRSLGGWKLLFFRDAWVMDVPPELERGRYLVEALAHCGECHTPRNALGGPDLSRWLAGAPNPSGQGTIPALTPDKLDWSAADIAYYLESGFTPEFDSVGGHMAAVVENFAQLSAEDRAAVAAYVKALPAP
ncbi:cytochrome c [Mesobacterium sp. TK19101]|uniref:Cytochrome c n=1 Tax=Mesobacterium hydrothermale TaxID=3111907 RepID=A0ABU6HES1_9RHOB|nr:cytochrome c [Mesobacterium sp. TK19101]MEC3860973.1 cytochrome c [Mesobacterium sp. TK19101]